MSFLNLWALWLAALAIPALLILYFLKLRRREEWVPSTLLWKRAVQDLQVNAPFQRLRKSLLLFLQLLILLAAILALTRPIVQSSAAQEGRLVLLIDRSGSMNTVEDQFTRLDLAKEQATRLVKTINQRSASWLSFLDIRGAVAKTQAMVVAFADRASVIAPFTPNGGELVDVIASLKPTDGQTRIREALELAEAYMSPPTMTTDQTPISTEAPAKVILISDGGISDVAQAVLRQGEIELIRVGQQRDNVALTAFRVQRNYERPELVNAFLQVENFSPQPVRTDVALYIDGVLAGARVRTVNLGPNTRGGLPAAGRGGGDSGGDGGGGTGVPAGDGGGTGTDVPGSGATGTGVPAGEPDSPAPTNVQGLSFELTIERAAVLEARIARDDPLMADNKAFAVVPPPRRLRVLVVTENNFFLDSVLSGLPLQERRFIRPDEYNPSGGEFVRDGVSTFDVVIFDKLAPKSLPIGNFFFIGAVPPVAGVEQVETFDEVQPAVWWDETHPILRHVGLDYVYVGKGIVPKVPREAEILIEGPRGPMLARYARDGRNCMLLAFAVENSTWWQKPSFPVFAYNAIRYLGGAAAAEQEPLRPGDTLRIGLPEGVASATLSRPDGEDVSITPDSSGMVYYGATSQVGIYRVRYERDGERREDLYAINLEDPAESDITPHGAESLGSPQIKAGQAITTSTPEVWRWFIGVALVVLLLEWWIYNRRVMI